MQRTEVCSFLFAAKATVRTIFSGGGYIGEGRHLASDYPKAVLARFTRLMPQGSKALTELLEQIQKEEENDLL